MRKFGIAPGSLLILCLIIIPVAAGVVALSEMTLGANPRPTSFFAGFMVAVIWKEINAAMLNRNRMSRAEIQKLGEVADDFETPSIRQPGGP